MAAALRNPACDGLEFDVRASRDGVPVLLHDETLERVQARPWRCDELTAAELAEAGVPTLEAVLALAGPTPFLDIELKGEPVPAVIATARARPRAGPAEDRRVVVRARNAGLARPGAPALASLAQRRDVRRAIHRDGDRPRLRRGSPRTGRRSPPPAWRGPARPGSRLPPGPSGGARRRLGSSGSGWRPCASRPPRSTARKSRSGRGAISSRLRPATATRRRPTRPVPASRQWTAWPRPRRCAVDAGPGQGLRRLDDGRVEAVRHAVRGRRS